MSSSVLSITQGCRSCDAPLTYTEFDSGVSLDTSEEHENTSVFHIRVAEVVPM
jgi:hypothetical protein